MIGVINMLYIYDIENYMSHMIKEDLWQSCTGSENIEGHSGQI